MPHFGARIRKDNEPHQQDVVETNYPKKKSSLEVCTELLLKHKILSNTEVREICNALNIPRNKWSFRELNALLCFGDMLNDKSFFTEKKVNEIVNKLGLRLGKTEIIRLSLLNYFISNANSAKLVKLYQELSLLFPETHIDLIYHELLIAQNYQNWLSNSKIFSESDLNNIAFIIGEYESFIDRNQTYNAIVRAIKKYEGEYRNHCFDAVFKFIRDNRYYLLSGEKQILIETKNKEKIAKGAIYLAHGQAQNINDLLHRLNINKDNIPQSTLYFDYVVTVLDELERRNLIGDKSVKDFISKCSTAKVIQPKSIRHGIRIHNDELTREQQETLQKKIIEITRQRNINDIAIAFDPMLYLNTSNQTIKSLVIELISRASKKNRLADFIVIVDSFFNGNLVLQELGFIKKKK